MRVHIWRNAVTRSVDIFVIRDDPKGSAHMARLDEHGRIGSWEPVERQARLPDTPTIRFDEEVLEGILREAGKVMQATDATVDALADTRQVRDRLLKLIEEHGL